MVTNEQIKAEYKPKEGLTALLGTTESNNVVIAIFRKVEVSKKRGEVAEAHIAYINSKDEKEINKFLNTYLDKRV